MNRARNKILVSGYVSRIKADANFGSAETWHACYENGTSTHYGGGLNAEACRAMVCARELRRVKVVKSSGAVIYKLRAADVLPDKQRP